MKKTIYILFFLTFNSLLIAQDGTLDNTFSNTIQSFWPRKIVELPNGKLLVSGYNLNPTIDTNGIIRINTDGSVDNTFNPSVKGGSSYGDVNDFVVSGSKILVGGNFTLVNGNTVGYITLLNAVDGSTDNLFNSGLGFNNQVNAVAVQPDGKFVIAGSFTTYNGTAVNPIVRINPNGSLDPSFNFVATTGLGLSFGCLYIEPISGKILVGAAFSSPQKGIYRLNADGSEDLSFNTGGVGVMGVLKGVECILPLDNEKYIIAGNFDGYNGIAFKNIVKINSDGSIDNTFNPGTGFDSYISSIDVQQDGKIVVGGIFDKFNNVSIKGGLSRLNSNGSFDNTFNPTGTGFSNGSDRITAVKVLNNGKIVVGGLGIRFYNEISVSNLIRLNGTTVLPITGFSLSGKRETTGDVLLNWQTLSEKDTKLFEVEVSNDGSTFRKIGELPASNNSNALKIYNKRINSIYLQKADIYFRVKSVEFSGKTSYSNTIKVDENASGKIRLFPNPASAYTVLYFPQEIKAAEISIFDAQGKRVSTTNVTITIGGQYKLSTANLLPGTYIVNVKTDRGNYSERLLINGN